jgi:hypothetical protein
MPDPIDYLNQDLEAGNLSAQPQTEFVLPTAGTPATPPPVPIQIPQVTPTQPVQSPVPGLTLPPNNGERYVSIDNILSGADLQALSTMDKDLLANIDSQLPLPAIEKLDRTEYMPGLEDPILKGNYSGRIVGNNPIFVRSGGYMPWGLVDARDRAQKAAIAARAAALSKFDMPEAPRTKEARWTGALQDEFYATVNKYIDESKKMYGDKWAVMLQDPRSALGRNFAQTLDNYNTVAKEIDNITDIMATIEKDDKEGKGTYSADTMQKYREYKKGIEDFANGKVDVNIRKNLNELVGTMSLDEKLKAQILPELERQVNENWGKFAAQGEYDLARKSRYETIEKGAREIAKQMKAEGGQYYNVDWVSEDMIYKRLKAMMPDIQEADIRTVGTPTRGGAGYEQKVENLTVQQNKVNNFANESGLKIPDEYIKKYGADKVSAYIKMNEGQYVRKGADGYYVVNKQDDGMLFNTNNAVATGAKSNAKPVYLSSAIIYDSNGNVVDKELPKDGAFVPTEFSDMKVKGANGKEEVVRVAVGYFNIEKEIQVTDPVTGQVVKTVKTTQRIPAAVDTRNNHSTFTASDAGAAYKYQEQNSNATVKNVAEDSYSTTKKSQEAAWPEGKKVVAVTRSGTEYTISDPETYKEAQAKGHTIYDEEMSKERLKYQQ